MSDTTKQEVCHHSMTQRNCPGCFDRVTATFRAKLTEAEAEIKRLQKLVGEIRTSRDKVGFQNDVLTAEVERLTKHVENLTSIKDDAIHVGEGLVARIKELEAERDAERKLADDLEKGYTEKKAELSTLKAAAGEVVRLAKLGTFELFKAIDRLALLAKGESNG
jgi:chromosome segregation ATPase